MITTGDVVLAHALGERYELPIPLWLFAAGGAAVVLVSFALLLRRTSPPAAALEAPDTVPPRTQRLLPGALALAGTVLVAYVGLAGTQETSYNLAPVVWWLLVWIAVPLSCGLLGDWTGQVNPFAVLGRLGDDARVRKLVLGRSRPLELAAGWWPAGALFVLLVLGELVFNVDTTRPAFVGGLLVVYGLASAFLGLLLGPAWLSRGEVLSGLFNAWGRLGWFRFGAPGRRGLGGGLDVPFEASAGRVVFVLLLLISINFDGLLATPQWVDYERTLGASGTGIDLLRTASLAVLVLLALAFFAGFAHASARRGGFATTPLRSLAVLLPSLVPIAYGYLIAHYLEYLVTNGQLLIPLSTDPGLGDGRSDFAVDLQLLPSSFYWYVSVVVIVAAHVVAVVLAHHALRRHTTDDRAALRSEGPWLVAMVAYTAFSLFLIAQPLTT